MDTVLLHGPIVAVMVPVSGPLTAAVVVNVGPEPEAVVKKPAGAVVQLTTVPAARPGIESVMELPVHRRWPGGREELMVSGGKHSVEQ